MVDKATAKGKNQNIQVLRGICALIVFLSHVLNMKQVEFVKSLMHTPLHFFFDGQIAVVVFFTLSGYYYYSNKELTVFTYLRGIKKKMLKIYPPHLIVLTLGFVFLTLYCNFNIHSCNSTEWSHSFWRNNISLKEFVGNSAVFLPHDSNAINPPTWYLTYEVRMIFILPVLIFLCKKTSFLFAWFIVVVSFIINIPFVGCIGSFLVGSLIHRYSEMKALPFLNSRICIFILVAVGIILLNINNNFFFRASCISNKNIIVMLQTIGAGLIIYMFNSTSISHPPKFLRWLGDISYEFYIVHFVILMILTPWISNWMVLLLMSLIISIGVSNSLHNIVSRDK